MKYVKLIVDWVLNSSANPQETSVMVRGALVAAVGVAVKVSATACLVGLACVALDQGMAGQIVDAIVNGIFFFLSFVGTIAFLAGLIRKLYRTGTGTLA